MSSASGQAGAVARAADVDCDWIGLDRHAKRGFELKGNPCASREVVGGAERDHAERARFALHAGQAIQHLVDRTVAADGDDFYIPLLERLLTELCGMTF